MTGLMTAVALLVATGYLMRRSALVSGEAASDLSRIVFYFTLPPLIFLALHRAELDWALLLMPAAAWGLLLAGMAVGLAVARALRTPGPRAGAVIIVTVFGNTTFLGYPVVQGFYGDEGLTLAIFYDLLGAAMVANTLAVLLASSLGGKEPVRAARLLRRLALFPPIWGLLLGLGLRGAALPDLLTDTLQGIANLTGPLIMLSIGMSLNLGAWRKDLGVVALATAGRLLGIPLAAYLTLNAIGFPDQMLRVAVLQAAMPSMFFSLTLALLFGLRKNIVVNTIMLSTLLSFATLPLWRWFLGP